MNPTKYLPQLASFMASLVKDGGPSVTRWVFVRTAEVVSIGWLGMCGSACYVFVKHQKVDVVFCGMILTLGGALFKFAQQTQMGKLQLDAASPGAAEPGNA